MKINNNIRINEFGQDIIDYNFLMNYYSSLNEVDKKTFRNDLFNIISQLKPLSNDIINAIDYSGLKSTYTPIVLTKKNLFNYNLYNKLELLPESEQSKVFKLLTSIFYTTYKRKIKEFQDNDSDILNEYSKWWFKDLNDMEFKNKISHLSNIDISKRLLKSNDKIYGVIYSAIPVFKLQLSDKELIENRLLTLVFNEFPNRSVSIFKRSEKDMASITGIFDINTIEEEIFKISLI